MSTQVVLNKQHFFFKIYTKFTNQIQKKKNRKKVYAMLTTKQKLSKMIMRKLSFIIHAVSLKINCYTFII